MTITLSFLCDPFTDTADQALACRLFMTFYWFRLTIMALERVMGYRNFAHGVIWWVVVGLFTVNNCMLLWPAIYYMSCIWLQRQCIYVDNKSPCQDNGRIGTLTALVPSLYDGGGSPCILLKKTLSLNRSWSKATPSHRHLLFRPAFVLISTSLMLVI